MSDTDGDKRDQPPPYVLPQAGYGPPPSAYPSAAYPSATYPSAPYTGIPTQPNQTTVIVQQPGAIGAPGAPGAAPRMWTTGLMDCCDDMSICLCGLFCATCLSCQVATDMGESGCVPILVPGADISLRVKWRTQENIQGSILDDCFTLWCCGPCGLCQLAREVKRKREGTLYPRA